MALVISIPDYLVEFAIKATGESNPKEAIKKAIRLAYDSKHYNYNKYSRYNSYSSSYNYSNKKYNTYNKSYNKSNNSSYNKQYEDDYDPDLDLETRINKAKAEVKDFVTKHGYITEDDIKEIVNKYKIDPAFVMEEVVMDGDGKYILIDDVIKQRLESEGEEEPMQVEE